MASNANLTTVESLRIALAELGLETNGHKPELKRRLRKAREKKAAEERAAAKARSEQVEKTNVDEEEKSAAAGEAKEEQIIIPNKNKSESSAIPKEQPLDYYLFFDVEATCEANGGFTFPNEIIEFPVVLVDGKTFEIVDEFQSYVKPSINPTLSDFCKELTGISQEQVDNSPDFVEVLNKFQEFMGKYSLFREKTAAFVTDGPFDIRDFITKQCEHSNLERRPAYFERPWVNIRKLFKDFYKLKENKNIPAMLEALSMEFKGHQHSGLDDARNLVRIAQKMKEDGCLFKTNMYWGHKMRNFHQQQQKQQRRRRKR
ncbi:hypothetical protein VTP01DRAFT_6058 [Rhizomucor pusillus]|uniref:uncharacterized protein n=1 Tax=Rhizomucor pusillus TaxID=4840 RepID=UPI00374208CB